ncbi:MAG: YecA family protein [Sarcina sp.]
MNNYEVNKSLGVNKPIKNELKACLNDLTRNKIDTYVKNYEIKGLAKLKKGEVIDKIYDTFITEKVLVTTLRALNSKDFKLIKELTENKVVDITEYLIFDYVNLFITGLAFIYLEKESVKLVMPDEIIELIKNSNINSIQIDVKEAYELENYLNSFVELYGAFEVDFFVNTFNEYTGKSLSTSELIELFNENDNTIGYAFLEDNYIMNQSVGSFEGYLEDILRHRIAGEYKVLDKETLLKYGEEVDYIEITPEYESFLETLEKVTNNKETALEILFDIQMSFTMNEYDIYEVVGNIDRFVDLDTVGKSLIDKAVKKSVAAYDNTRRWNNRGFTNIELKSLQPVKEVVKVGRNESCPCGSGKKYKKCCINA